MIGVATGPYVDRLIRIFRDRPNDDTSALVLIDFANASIAASRCHPLSRDVMLRIVRDYEEMGSPAMVEYLRDKASLAVGHRDSVGLIERLIEHAAAYGSSVADILCEAADAIAALSVVSAPVGVEAVGEVRIQDGCIVSTSIKRPLADGGYDVVPQSAALAGQEGA